VDALAHWGLLRYGKIKKYFDRLNVWKNRWDSYIWNEYSKLEQIVELLGVFN